MSARHRDRVGDLAVLQRLLDGFHRVGLPVDKPTVTALGYVVTAWPPTKTIDISEIAREQYQRGRSMNAIGQQLGVDRRTVSQMVADLPKRVGRGHTIPAEARERALELVRAGETHARAAQEAGISPSVVSRLASAREIERQTAA